MVRPLLVTAILPLLLLAQVPDSSSNDSLDAQKKALERFNALVGKWRGVGQPKRGSNRGAWSESAEWAWHFEAGRAEVRGVVTDGKYIRNARIGFDPKADEYVMTVAFHDGPKRIFRGKVQEKRIVLISPEAAGQRKLRVTLTLLNEKRALLLFERGRSSWLREAGIGYTRAGASLATAGVGGRECVVTGGAGTIAVTHKGKTWYVCCSGCRQAFEDDPEGVIRDYQQRIRERKEKAAGTKAGATVKDGETAPSR